MHAKHIHFIIGNSKILSTLPKGKNSCPSPWIAFSTGNSYGDVYTDREETENEKGEKTATFRSLPILPLVLWNMTMEPMEEVTPWKCCSWLIVVKCYTVILDSVLLK